MRRPAKPILFSGPMVNAILDRTKTVTRRVVRDLHRAAPRKAPITADSIESRVSSPYGRPPSLLWVRETWGVDDPKVLTQPVYDGGQNAKHIHYRAAEERIKTTDIFPKGYWRSPLFMPQWASRMTLEVTAVRVERLQDITREDVIAEGVKLPVTTKDCPRGKARVLTRVTGKYPPYAYLPKEPVDADFYRAEYASLWDSLNGDRPYCAWEDNPWVWVVSFKRVRS